MKTLTFPKAALCLVLSAAMFSSCQKEISQSPITTVTTNETHVPSMHSYSDTATGIFSHRPYPTLRETLSPSTIKAWYAISGIGRNSEVPKTTTLCNQLFGVSPSGSFFLPAPVTKFFEQKLRHEKLPAIPENVSCITYDHSGNSIWFQLNPLSVKKIDEKRIEFSGTSNVVGGTGMFEGAKGTVTTSGYFNLLDEDDAAIGNRGTILY